MKKRLLVTGLLVLLQACNQVDNFVLGKDNTPKPAPLTPITSKARMTVKWTAPIGKAKKTAVGLKLKPVIRGSVIYTADASGLVQAIDKNTGHIFWSKYLDDGLVSGPTVAEGYIALGTNTSHVVLLKQSDGHQVWKVSVSSDSLSKPVIARQKVIVKTIDGNLYAFELQSGKKIWVVDHGSPGLILKASSSPVVMGDVVLVGFSDGKLDAVNMNFGHVLWQRSIAYARGSSDVERLVDIDADPIVRKGMIWLASYQGYVGALSLQTGQFVWSKPASTYRNMAMDNNTLYMTDSNDTLWAYDAQNGQVKWKQTALKARGLTEPVLAGNRLVVGDKTGYLHLVSARSGEIVARVQLGGAIEIAPAVSGRHVYVMTAKGQLNCISVD
jgi:outer membrane protein assembly factor BamB